MSWGNFYIRSEFEGKVIEALSKELNIDESTLVNEAIGNYKGYNQSSRLQVKLTEESEEKLSKVANKTSFVRNAIMEYAKKNGVIAINE